MNNPDDRPDVARLANNALEAAGKAAGLTSQLLSFARRQRLDPQPLDAVEVIESMWVLLDRTVGERIALSLDSETGVPPCLADLNQLESALLNLVINARDALAGATGSLTISVRGEHVAGASTGWPPEGDYVRVAVRDDGPGMTEEVRRRPSDHDRRDPAVGAALVAGLSSPWSARCRTAPPRP